MAGFQDLMSTPWYRNPSQMAPLGPDGQPVDPTQLATQDPMNAPLPDPLTNNLAQQPQSSSFSAQIGPNGKFVPDPLNVVMQRIMGTSRKAAAGQEEGVQSLKDRIKALTATPAQNGGIGKVLSMAADTWGGGGGEYSKLYDQANPNMNAQQKQEAIDKLEGTLRQARGDMSQNDLNLLHMQLQYELGKDRIQGKQNSGKPLPMAVMEQLAALDSAGKNVDQSEALAHKFNGGNGGGYMLAGQSKFAGNHAYDYANAQEALKGQILGNLTKARLNPKTIGLGEDYLPGAIDANDSIKSKIGNTRQVIADKKQALMDLARSQGYNVDSIPQTQTQSAPSLADIEAEKARRAAGKK